MRVYFEFEIMDLLDNASVSLWPGAFISHEDGCCHAMITDLSISGQNDSMEIVIIPNKEYHCMVG